MTMDNQQQDVPGSAAEATVGNDDDLDEQGAYDETHEQGRDRTRSNCQAREVPPMLELTQLLVKSGSGVRRSVTF